MRFLATATFLAVACAQTPPVFEVASVKAIPESAGAGQRKGYWVGPRMEDPRRFRALTYFQSLIEWAYHVRDFQVVGGPPWMREVHARFELQATAERESTVSEMRQMVQALLSDRFQLKLHRETREFQVYALVVGKRGARLSASTDLSDGDGALDIGQGKVISKGIGMATFVRILSENLERPVIDRTELTGKYDFTLEYEQSSLPDWRLGPALFTMVQDLGLRLEPRKESIEVLVIDSVAQPSGN